MVGFQVSVGYVCEAVVSRVVRIEGMVPQERPPVVVERIDVPIPAVEQAAFYCLQRVAGGEEKEWQPI